MNRTRALSAAFPLVVVALLSCKTNHAPDAPAVTAGPQYCLEESTYIFSAEASDPDGDSVSVRFDWGDSTFSHWVGWFASGETVAFTHAWADTGTYEVSVSSQDRQRTSAPSEGYVVQVVVRFPPATPVMPRGPDVGGQDSTYRFTSGADHPDGIPVAIRFAWGDGDTSDWSEFGLSGAPVTAKHAWSTPDTYVITAQAKDTGEVTSLWSTPDTIVIRPRDTMRLWRVQLTHGHSANPASPAVAPDGTIYVGSPDGSLYAVEPRGVVKWRYVTGGAVQSSPAIAADGTIYFGSNDSCLYALNPDGILMWKYVTGGVVLSSPAIAADGTIYVGSEDYFLYALNADGTLRWRYAASGAGVSSPAVAADGTVYFGADDHSIYALSPNGTQKWHYVSGIGGAFASPAVGSDGAIYCGARVAEWGGFLCSLNPDGTLRWSFMADGAIGSSPAIGVDGTVYFGTSGSSWWGGYSRLYALNADGTLKWFSEPNGPAGGSSPAVSSFGPIYFGELGLHAVYPDGTSKFLYRPTDYYGYVSSPSIGLDGTLYFVCDDGYLYALNGTGPLANSPWPKFQHDLQNTGRTDQAGWSRLRMVGSAALTPDSSSFRIIVVNDGTVDATVSSLEFLDSPDSAYMRDFLIEGNHGIGFPLGPTDAGIGRGDTVHFAPVTIAPDMSQMSEFFFMQFYVDRLGNGTLANVGGKEFVLRFSDGSVIAVTP